MKGLLTLIAAAAIVSAQPASAGMIAFTQDSTKVTGYLALPAGEGTHPGVVVIQEWWGLTDWIKAQADSLARLGYVAFAVDLYKGKVATDQETAHQLAMALDADEALRMLRAGADFLRSRSDVRAQAIGSIGWCMGGGYSIRLAASDPGIRACVMFYGAPLTNENSIKALQAPVLGNFGGEDKGPTPEQVKTFEDALKKAGKKVDFKIYPGAGHAFANPSNPWHGYRASAAKDAWDRTVKFFDQELKKASIPKSHE
jgi:carboxymethylenebutenolidase